MSKLAFKLIIIVVFGHFSILVQCNIRIGEVIIFVIMMVAIFRNWYYVTSAVGQPGFVPRNYMQETSATSEEKTSHCQKVMLQCLNADYVDKEIMKIMLHGCGCRMV